MVGLALDEMVMFENLYTIHTLRIILYRQALQRHVFPLKTPS